MTEQLNFDWTSAAHETSAPMTEEEKSRYRQRLALRRGVLRWLVESEHPTGFALDVVTRIARFHADLGAFWSVPVRNHAQEGPTQVWEPTRTCIVQCYLTREECWPDCSRSQELVPQLKGLKEQLRALEGNIRQDEPELRDGGSLFDEYAVWRYAETGNPDYHRLRREIDRTEQAIYQGSQFERIRRAALADHLYLAVPAGLIQPEELAEGWGLLWVDPELKVDIALPAEERKCLPGNRLHLVQNIAAAGADAVAFAMGVRQQKDGTAFFVQPPRGHRRPQKLTLP